MKFLPMEALHCARINATVRFVREIAGDVAEVCPIDDLTQILTVLLSDLSRVPMPPRDDESKDPPRPPKSFLDACDDARKKLTENRRKKKN